LLSSRRAPSAAAAPAGPPQTRRPTSTSPRRLFTHQRLPLAPTSGDPSAGSMTSRGDTRCGWTSIYEPSGGSLVHFVWKAILGHSLGPAI
jgi:hypothetical protein